MSTFTTKFPETTVEDPYKRVRYATGLVLGVDEFEQEQAYFIERDRLLTRALHGYGVVQGLSITVEVGGDQPQLVVGPGLAVEPSGQHVCIDRSQCAPLDDWLAARGAETLSGSEEEPDGGETNGEGSAGDDGENEGGENGDGADSGTRELCVAIVLRYGACETDFVPVPGEPCRTEEETRTASRLADDFHLTLEPVAEAPPHLEDEAVRTFGRLLRALDVRVHDSYASVDAVRTLVEAVPDVAVGAGVDELIEAAGLASDVPTVENGGTVVPIRAEEAHTIHETALRTWVGTARPRILGRENAGESLPGAHCAGDACHPVPEDDDGLVLGTLCLDVSAGEEGLVRETEAGSIADGLTTDERPILVATRIFQELFGGMERDESLRGESAGGDLTGTYPDPTIARLQGEDLSMVRASSNGASEGPSDGDVLTYDGETWRPDAPPEGTGSDVEVPPSNAETDLTRIVALSWQHDGYHRELRELSLTFPPDGFSDEVMEDVPSVVPIDREAPYLGLAVAFGREALDLEEGRVIGVEEAGSVRAETLTPESFRVYVEWVEPDIASVTDRRSLTPAAVVPLREVHVTMEERDGRAITRVTGGTIGMEDGFARGAAFVFPDSFEEMLERVRNNRLDVEIRGDFLLDADRRAVDAEFARGELPTGDRPGANGASTAGVQGGRFTSWLHLWPRFVRLNTADVDELDDLPEVGARIADLIVQFREERGDAIVDPLQLAEIPGLTEDLIRQNWEGRVEPPVPPR